MVVKLLWQLWSFLSVPSRRHFCFLTHQQDLFSKHAFYRDLSSQQSICTDKSQKFYEAMKDCVSLSSVPIACKLHGQLVSTGLGSSVYLQNHLVHMYFSCHLVGNACRVFSEIEFPNVFSWNTMINGLANCGRLCEAAKLFEKMPQRDIVSWNTMMSGYFNNGRPGDSIRVFISLLQECFVSPIPSSFSSVMKACASICCLRLALQLHGSAERHGFSDDTSVKASIIDMYIKCDAVSYAEQVFHSMKNPNLFCCNSMIYGYFILYGVEAAMNLFYQMPEHDDVSWSTMISLSSQHGYGSKALNMFVEMWNQGFMPNSMTYASVIRACTALSDLDWGCHLHARILRMESSLDAYTGNALIDMYAKGGFLDSARRVFDCLTEHNVVSWTSLIAGNVQFGRIEKALALFNQMRKVPLFPDAITVSTVLGGCTSYKDITLGMQLHGYTVKTGTDSLTPVGNALITMYGKVGSVRSAETQFDLMPIKDIISWTAVITAFSQNSDVEKAREYFDKMPERNVVTWNSMMAAYVQNGFGEEGLKLHGLMLRHGIELDSITFVTSISACADSALLELGSQIVAQAIKSGFASYVSVANSAVTMYSKCGLVTEAEKVFNSITTKNVISWNAMMAGYAQNGLGMKTIEMFKTMVMFNFAPDDISYVSLLMGCSHAGLVEEGCHYFNSMKHDHGICPTRGHYACMVDLLGRAGFIEQALAVIAEMPFKATDDVWGALLAACRTKRSTKFVEFAARKLLELDIKGSGSYSLLANLYSESGKLEHVTGVRKLMRDKGIQKVTGCSWIEIHNTVQVFTADGSNNPQIIDVIKMLERLCKMEDMNSNENEQNLLDPGGCDMLLV